jgi:hypothetical protein
VLSELCSLEGRAARLAADADAADAAGEARERAALDRAAAAREERAGVDKVRLAGAGTRSLAFRERCVLQMSFHAGGTSRAASPPTRPHTRPRSW